MRRDLRDQRELKVRQAPKAPQDHKVQPGQPDLKDQQVLTAQPVPKDRPDLEVPPEPLGHKDPPETGARPGRLELQDPKDPLDPKVLKAQQEHKVRPELQGSGPLGPKDRQGPRVQPALRAELPDLRDPAAQQDP